MIDISMKDTSWARLLAYVTGLVNQEGQATPAGQSLATETWALTHLQGWN